MTQSLEKININDAFAEKYTSKKAQENYDAVSMGKAANEALKTVESHDTDNKEVFSMHEMTPEDKIKISKLQTRTETWKQYLDSLSVIDTRANDVIKAIEQEQFNISALPKTSETEKIKNDLDDLKNQYIQKLRVEIESTQ